MPTFRILRSLRVSHLRPVIGTAIAALTLAVIAAVPQAAHAQDSTTFPVRIKAGIFEPKQGGMLYGVEGDLVEPGSAGAMGLLSAGYMEGKHGGRDYRMIPVELSKVTGLANPVAGVTGNIYVGGGFGAYFLRASGDGAASESKTRYGAFFQAGYKSPFGLFIEGKYRLVSGGVTGMSANGVSIFLGTKL